MGENSISQYLMIRATKEGLHIGYRLDFAENPTATELRDLDADHDGVVSDAEQKKYLDSRSGEWGSRISVVMAGKEIAAKLADAELKVAEGVGGRKTLLVMLDFVVATPALIGSNHASLAVGNYSRVPGWREAAVLAGEGCWVLDGQMRVKAMLLEQRAESAEHGKDWTLTFIFDRVMATTRPAGH